MIDVSTATPDELFAYALAVEPRLRAINEAVRTFVANAPTDRAMCAHCVWDLIEPLASPWIGWERGLPHRDATEPEPARFMTGAEFILDAPTPLPAGTEVERWLRSSAAWDALTARWRKQLEDADPGHGCGVGTLPTPAGRP